MPVPHIILLDEHVTPDTTWIMVHCVFTLHVTSVQLQLCKGQSDSRSEHTYIIMIITGFI